MPSINPYQFGFNNPVYFSDPTGLTPGGGEDPISYLDDTWELVVNGTARKRNVPRLSGWATFHISFAIIPTSGRGGGGGRVPHRSQSWTAMGGGGDGAGAGAGPGNRHEEELGYFHPSNYGKGPNPYSPYIPDGLGVTVGLTYNLDNISHSISASLVVDSQNNFALFGNHSTSLDTSGSMGAFASFDIHDNFGGNSDLFSGLQGQSIGGSASYIYSGSYYSSSVNGLMTQSGVQTFSIGLSPSKPGLGFGITNTYLLWKF